MNRSNLGNQVANGMQVLSVGTFTGGNWKRQQKQRRLADASSALNNMSLDEARQVGRMRAEQLNEEVRAHNNNYDGKSLLTDEEQRAVGQAKATELKENARQAQNKTSGVVNLSDEEQQAYGNKRADDLRKYINGSQDGENGEEMVSSVDELMPDNKVVSSISKMKSPQSDALTQSIITNSKWLAGKNVGQDAKTGRFVSLKHKKEGDE